MATNFTQAKLIMQMEMAMEMPNVNANFHGNGSCHPTHSEVKQWAKELISFHSQFNSCAYLSVEWKRFLEFTLLEGILIML